MPWVPPSRRRAIAKALVSCDCWEPSQFGTFLHRQRATKNLQGFSGDEIEEAIRWMLRERFLEYQNVPTDVARLWGLDRLLTTPESTLQTLLAVAPRYPDWLEEQGLQDPLAKPEATVNSRMIDTLHKQPESKGWSVRRWARASAH
jgi:hypothetical protein